MRILVTGADGFVGRRLTASLLNPPQTGANTPAVSSITLLDRRIAESPTDPRVRRLEGDITDEAVRAEALSDRPDLVFHLAAVPGGATEADPRLGRAVNVEATTALLDTLSEHSEPVRFVYCSTIGVYGEPPRTVVHDDILPVPAITYGAQKLMMEIYLSDLARRGSVDARIVRLPGIVARPRQPSGMISAFMSELFHAIRAGERMTCPTSPDGTVWIMSVARCVDNLLHAGMLAPSDLPARRVWQLPALRVVLGELADVIAEQTGRDALDLVSWAPEPRVQAEFASYPELSTALADRLGFEHDGTLHALVSRVLGDEAAMLGSAA